MTTSTETPAIAKTLDSIRNGILHLRGDCDGAREIDGQGFGKFDVQAGFDFAAKIRAGTNFTPKQFAYMGSLCVKYRRQLVGTPGFDEVAIRAFIESVKSGNFAAPAPVATEAKPDPQKEWVATIGAFLYNSESGAAAKINFGNGKTEWVPVKSIHPDDKLPKGMPVEFRVHRWVFESKRLPVPPKAQPALAATSGELRGNTLYKASAPRPVTTHVIE